MPDRCRLGLGTVQFGLDYGIANTGGQVALPEVAAILAEAAESGIRVLDTAAAYGDSEAVLGKCLGPGSPFRIVTKTLPLRRERIGAEDVEEFAGAFRESLRRLGRPAVDTLLVHHADDLLVPGGEQLFERLMEWKAAGLVGGIGVSIYDRTQIDRIFDRFLFDVVQLPVSVYDQRLLADGTLALLHRSGIEIHARSVFLQGMLLMPVESLPPHFSGMAAHHRRYLESLHVAGVDPLAAAIGFVAGLAEVGVVLVGVDSRSQLKECIAAFDRAPKLDAASFAINDERLVDPRRWPPR